MKTLLTRGSRPLRFQPGRRFWPGRIAQAGAAAVVIAGLVAGPAAPASAAASAMSLTVASNPDSVSTGQAMAYSITAANTGGSAASGLTITDTITDLIPANGATAPFFTASTGSCAYAATTSQVTCTAPSLAAGQVWTVTITAADDRPGRDEPARHRHGDRHRVRRLVQRVGDHHDHDQPGPRRRASPRPSWRAG